MGDEAAEWTIDVAFAYRQQAEMAAERLAADGFAATADGSVLTIRRLTEAQSDELTAELPDRIPALTSLQADSDRWTVEVELADREDAKRLARDLEAEQEETVRIGRRVHVRRLDDDEAVQLAKRLRGRLPSGAAVKVVEPSDGAGVGVGNSGMSFSDLILEAIFGGLR